MEIPWDEAIAKTSPPPLPRLSTIKLTANDDITIDVRLTETFDPEKFLYSVDIDGIPSVTKLEIEAIPQNDGDKVSFQNGTIILNPQQGNFFAAQVFHGDQSATYIVVITDSSSGNPPSGSGGGTASLTSLSVDGGSVSLDNRLVYDVPPLTAGGTAAVTFSWSVSGNTNAVEYSTNSGATWTVNTTNNITTGFTVASNASKILLIRLTSTDGAQTTYYINVRRAAAGDLLLSLTVGSSSVTIGYTMRPAYASIGYPAGTFGITAGFPPGGSVTYSDDIPHQSPGLIGTTSTIVCGTLSAGVSKTILITVTLNGTSETHALILYKPDAYYVKNGGTGNGETAAAPFNNLKAALDAAQASGGNVNRVVVIGELTEANAAGLDGNSNSAFYLAGTETTSYVLYGTAPGGTITISGMNNAVLKATPTLHNGESRVLRISGGHYLNFEDITITGGSSSGSGGGGIFISGDSHITLSTGAKITGNAAFTGGGIYVTEAGTLTIDGADISGNIAVTGGGISIGDASNLNGTVIFKSGTISGNSTNFASYGGGGIYINSNGYFTMNGGNIYGNSSKTSGGGIYVGSTGTMIYNSGSIRTNVVGTVGTHYGKSIYKAIGGTVGGSVGSTILWMSASAHLYTNSDLP